MKRIDRIARAAEDVGSSLGTPRFIPARLVFLAFLAVEVRRWRKRTGRGALLLSVVVALLGRRLEHGGFEGVEAARALDEALRIYRRVYRTGEDQEQQLRVVDARERVQAWQDARRAGGSR